MIIVIDGYNVLRSVIHVGLISEQQRREFINQLSSYAKKKGHAIVVVFDGGPDVWPTKERIKNIDVVYSGVKESADDYIVRYIQERRSHDIMLVSSDRELRDRVAPFSVTPIGAYTFYMLVQQDKDAEEKTASRVEDTKAVKTTQTVIPKLDKLMEEVVDNIGDKVKYEEPESERGKAASHTLRKKERKVMQKIKKL